MKKAVGIDMPDSFFIYPADNSCLHPGNLVFLVVDHTLDVFFVTDDHEDCKYKESHCHRDGTCGHKDKNSDCRCGTDTGKRNDLPEIEDQ